VGSLFSCSTYFSVSLVRQTRNSLTPAITAGGLQILAVLLFFSSRQFDKLPLSSTSFLVSFTSSSLPLSPAAFPAKIPSSELYRRRRHCRSDHRRSFSDEELAENLTYEELVRLRVPFTMAARIVPAVSRPLPTFSGSKKEDVLEFIEAIHCAHQRKRALYNDETAPIAKRSLLVEGCKGKPTLFIKGLAREKKDTWEHLVAELTEKYASSSAEDRARAFQKAMKLKQKSDEELRTYAKRAKKLAKRVDPTLEKVVAAKFVQGIRNRNIRVMVAANSQSKSDYTFRDVYQAVQAVARAREEDSESESDSDSSTSTDSSTSVGPRKGSDSKEPKVKEIEVKMPAPASSSPKFNMDDLNKVIEVAVQAATRKLVGPYGLVPGPVLGQPLQAPMIESYAVSSQSRPPFSGRSYPYGGQGGFQQQQPGGFQGGFQQQQPGGQGGYQQPSGQFGGPSQYPRSSNITCYNCEERGHGYQQCPKPPQPDEARRAIYDRVNADKNWSYSAYNAGQQRYQPPYRRSTDNSRPAFMEPYSAQDARSSGQPQPPVTTPQNPRISEANLVEEMSFSSSALGGVTVANADFTEVSMIEEIFAVEKRKATRSGPDSDGSDRRIAKKVAQDPQQDTQQAQFAVRGSADAQAAASGGPSTTQASVAGGPSQQSILERPRAVAYSRTRKQPVAGSIG
jgi:hypothetical protein